MLHGCTIGDNSLIGMGAILLNGSKIGTNCLVGAGALVPEGKEFPDNSLIVGAPARVVRPVDEETVKMIAFGADIYVKRSQAICGSNSEKNRVRKYMKYLVVAAVAAFASLTVTPAYAQNRFKDCAGQWNAMKEAKQTEGKNYRAFQKECLSRQARPRVNFPRRRVRTTSRPASRRRSGRPKRNPTHRRPAKQKKTSPAKEAATVRRRECSAEWKADKAAGKIADGMKWPQYYSACNARKKGTAV